MSSREAVLAGMWYPGTERGCRLKIEQLMGDEAPAAAGIGGIVPHAGWEYSGALAIKVYRAIAAADPELLILFGTHMAPGSAPHISRATGFETPLGTIAADTDLAARIAEALELDTDPADSSWRSDGDNTIEVQLPMIKHFMPDTRLVVIAPPFGSRAVEIGSVAAREAKGPGVRLAVVGSTDLTHYGPRFGFAPKGRGEAAARWVREENDARVIRRMLDLDPEGVLEEAARNHNACVPGAVAAAIAAARELGATSATLLDYRTSYDLQPGDTFVGYAAVVMRVVG